MTVFATKRLPVAPDYSAPDGSDVRLLLELVSGSMAHFELGPGMVTEAVCHKTVEEIWFFLGGRGTMWRKQGEEQGIVPVDPGVCITIPVGTHFQFRCHGYHPLSAIAVTMPPWPGADEAVKVEGKWPPALRESLSD